jgi:hypothetical protein
MPPSGSGMTDSQLDFVIEEALKYPRRQREKRRT